MEILELCNVKVKCPGCQREIRLSAKVCPRCKKDLVQYRRQKARLTLLGFIVFVLLLLFLSPGLLANYWQKKYLSENSTFLLDSLYDKQTWLVSLGVWLGLAAFGIFASVLYKLRKSRLRVSQESGCETRTASPYSSQKAKPPGPFSFTPFPGGEAVHEYSTKHRNPNSPPLASSAALDLYPSRPSPTGFNAKLTWRDPWPYAESPGVYIIYAENLELMYVGKTSMNRCLGRRLYEYFGGGAACTPKAQWLTSARYVINIAVPQDHSFEAPALEEFLIKKLQPRCNVVGR